MSFISTRPGRTAATCTALSLLACYGTLAALAVLGAAGVAISVNGAVWAASITGLAILASLALGSEVRRHRKFGPFLLGITAVLAIGYTTYWSYSLSIELAGFSLLCGATIWDKRLQGVTFPRNKDEFDIT